LEPKKQAQQFILAEKKGIPWVIIPGNDGSFVLRNIATRMNTENLDIKAAVSMIKDS
jgi:histidyl-tRNA synthetase